MKKILILMISCISPLFFLQNNAFPYVQSWGSYIGGAGTKMHNIYKEKNGINVDSNKNLYLIGNTTPLTGYSDAYYNQFIMGIGLPIVVPNQNYYHTIFNENGQMLFGSYTGVAYFTNTTLMVGIDHEDNKYYIKYELGHIDNLATAGVWLSQNQNLGPNTITLSKYNANNILQWTTYLPNQDYNMGYGVRFDEANNIYLNTNISQPIPNLATTGVFQENYISYNSPNSDVENAILVKLNPSGQKIWATYCITGIGDMEYYNNALYTTNAYNINMPGVYTTPGTFQPNQMSNTMLMKFDANTGQQIWGTYYGTPYNNLYNGSVNTDIEVNETGLYVMGQSESADYPNYFATAGAFKSQMTGGGDFYLSKFNHNGGRVWSTYFGTNNYEYDAGYCGLSILGNKIMITGNQYICTENIATPNAFRTSPANTGNGHSSMFFAEFDTSGNRLWSSYFGGYGDSGSFEFIMPEYLSDGSFILWGSTAATTGVATQSGHYPSMINPFPNSPFGYVTRFNLKNSEMSTTETDVTKDLILYDNPNNGNFYISGTVLHEQHCILQIYDLSGRLMYQEHLPKNQKHFFALQDRLTSGNYMLKLTNKQNQLIKTFKLLVK